MEVIPAAGDLSEHGVARVDVLDHGRAAGEVGGKAEDFVERNALGHHHVVDDGEHQDEVEAALGAIEERLALRISPAERGGRPRQVNDQGQNIEILGRRGAPDAINNGFVVVDSDDFGAFAGGVETEEARIAADVEHAGRRGPGQGVRDESGFDFELAGRVAEIAQIAGPVRLGLGIGGEALNMALKTAVKVFESKASAFRISS